MWRASPRHSIHSTVRLARLALNTPRAGLFVIVTCAPVYRRVPPPCACRCQVRDGCTTSYDHGARVLEWSRRLTANRAVHVPLLETARRSWNGAGNVPVGTLPVSATYPGGHRGINRHRCRSRGALRLRIWCSR